MSDRQTPPQSLDPDEHADTGLRGRAPDSGTSAGQSHGAVINRVTAMVVRQRAEPGSVGSYYVRPPWRNLTSPVRETLLVRIEDTEGRTGWGEAMTPVAPEVVQQIVQRMLAPVLVGGDVARPAAHWYELRDLMRERGHLVGHQADALAAVDMALWDLAGKVLDVPLSRLLGGDPATSIPTYRSIGLAADLGETIDRIGALAAEGCDHVKLHLGHGVARDVACIAAIHDQLPDTKIAVDVHGRYAAHEAHRLTQELASLGTWFLESPALPDDRITHARLVGRGAPIAAGEALRNRFEFVEWLSSGALEIAQPDVCRTGITEMVAIAALCDAYHVAFSPHVASSTTSIGISASLNVAAVAPTLMTHETHEPADDICHPSMTGETARINLPAGPGLGVEPDLDSVRFEVTH